MILSNQEIEDLRLFTVDAIRNEAHKKRLRKAGFIEYSHRMWHLSKLGQAEATARGFI